MKIREVVLENFQGALATTTVKLGNFAVLVGRNDVGKSTLLKALDTFLNGATPTADAKNVHTASHNISVEVAFVAPTGPIVIDDAAHTTFASEALTDEQGYLRLRKEWDVSASKPVARTSVRRATYGMDDFLLATEADLIKKCKKAGIDTQKGNGEEFNNVEKREKLRAHADANNVPKTYEWTPLPTAGTSRAKLIHDAIRGFLPSFEYFRADTPLEESDAAIQKHFRLLAQAALHAAGMDDIEGEVEAKLQAALTVIANKINQVLPTHEHIKPSVQFDWPKAINTTFRTTQEQGDIPLGQRGDGFRRITMMSYFEYLAEEDNGTEVPLLLGFEEPETFLHPTAQEQLFEKLEVLSDAGHQVLVSSHSPIIVARSQLRYLIHVSKPHDTVHYRTDIDDLMPIANDLGIRVDNQFLSIFDKAKVLLLVEGVDDAIALAFIAAMYKGANEISKTFAELDIVPLPIGGCDSVQHWVQLDLLQKLSKPFFILLDSDRKHDGDKSPNEERLTQLGFTLGINSAVTKKRALENYIPAAALNKLVPGANVVYGDFDDVKDICKKHPMASALGGKKVVSKHFCALTYDEVKTAYQAPGEADEFMELYAAVCSLLPKQEAATA